MFGYVTSNTLHNRSTRLCNTQVYEKCTLLPFFDDEGVVRRVMVVGPGLEDVNFFDPSQVRLRIPAWACWGKIVIESSFPTLEVLEYEDLGQLSSLWHFDPWGVLTSCEEPQKRWSQSLVSTNCANRFVLSKGSVPSVWYARDLARIAIVECKYGGCSTWKRFKPEFLPKREELAAEHARYEWRLVPFWIS